MWLESNGVAADDDEDDEFAVADLANKKKDSSKLIDQLMALAAMMLIKEW